MRSRSPPSGANGAGGRKTRNRVTVVKVLHLQVEQIHQKMVGRSINKTDKTYSYHQYYYASGNPLVSSNSGEQGVTRRSSRFTTKCNDISIIIIEIVPVTNRDGLGC